MEDFWKVVIVKDGNNLAVSCGGDDFMQMINRVNRYARRVLVLLQMYSSVYVPAVGEEVSFQAITFGEYLAIGRCKAVPDTYFFASQSGIVFDGHHILDHNWPAFPEGFEDFLLCCIVRERSNY